MGDFPGSPSVAPSLPFCTAPWGGKGAMVGFTRCSGSPESVVNTVEGQKRWRTEVVSTPLYAAPPVAAKLAPFSPSSSFSLFLFRPCFVFPFSSRREELLRGPKLQNVAMTREVADSSCSVQRRQGEERRRGVSV
jgi:hypothetical protein